MIITLADGSKVECEDQPFAEGGEGLLFWDKAGTHVIKLYKYVDPQREAALQKIIGPEYSVVLGEPYWDELFAWPKAIIKQPALGLTMLRAPKGTMELKWFLGGKPRRVVAMKHGPDKLGNWLNNLSLAIKMARVVRRMHFRGLCHSDLSFRNFLVDPQQNRVVLIDCDGLVVPGFLPPNVLGTPMCMAPELMAQTTSSAKKVDPSSQTDLHALATLIYWLLFQRHPLIGPKMHSQDPVLDEALALGERALFIEHPTDKSNHIPNLPVPYTSMLTPAVQHLVERAFVHGLHNPAKRPSAADWERFLVRMTDSIVVCQNKKCPLGAFILQPQRPARCPACNTPLKNPPYVPILNFYQPRGGRKGHFQNDRGYALVGWPGRALHVWHASPSQAPGPGVDHNPKATLEFDHRQGKWYLQNADLADVHLLDSVSGHQDVNPGKRVELTDGARLLLGPPDRCRLAYVQMLKLE
jgi:DNA-binding helix-hairpin-helix protein with protein kinase domain